MLFTCQALLSYLLTASFPVISGAMPPKQPLDRVPFSARLTLDENALLLALSRHIGQRENRNVRLAEVMRRGLEALAKQEQRKGFDPNV